MSSRNRESWHSKKFTKGDVVKFTDEFVKFWSDHHGTRSESEFSAIMTILGRHDALGLKDKEVRAAHVLMPNGTIEWYYCDDLEKIL